MHAREFPSGEVEVADRLLPGGWLLQRGWKISGTSGQFLCGPDHEPSWQCPVVYLDSIPHISCADAKYVRNWIADLQQGGTSEVTNFSQFSEYDAALLRARVLSSLATMSCPSLRLLNEVRPEFDRFFSQDLEDLVLLSAEIGLTPARICAGWDSCYQQDPGKNFINFRKFLMSACADHVSRFIETGSCEVAEPCGSTLQVIPAITGLGSKIRTELDEHWFTHRPAREDCEACQTSQQRFTNSVKNSFQYRSYKMEHMRFHSKVTAPHDIRTAFTLDSGETVERVDKDADRYRVLNSACVKKNGSKAKWSEVIHRKTTDLSTGKVLEESHVHDDDAPYFENDR